MVEDDLNGLKVAAFRTAVRLFRDARVLLDFGSAKTALAIAVLAYEEVGKVSIADRYLAQVCEEASRREVVARDFQRTSRSHKAKQGWAAIETGWIESPEFKQLERMKQEAIYSDMTPTGIKSPSVSLEEAKDVLREVFEALEKVGDLGYNGIDAISSGRSEWRAASDIAAIRQAYERAVGI